MKTITDKLHVLYILVLLLQPLPIFGQSQPEYTVSGVIMEETSGTPLAFSRIYVKDSLGTQVARTLTLDDGKFRFKVKSGTYSVLFANTGHRSVTRSLTVVGADCDMGETVMTVGEEIDGAGITAANLLTRADDRYIYDVSRDPDKDRISMTEMMSRIPQLRQAAKDGRLEFRNEKVAEILIDDAKSGFINASRQYPMEFIRAGYMKTIELVMPGSLEYRNDKPILLITLAKALPYGFAGNIEGQAGTRNTYSPSADIVANTPWIGAGVSYDYGYSGEPALTDGTVREMSDGTVIDSRTTDRKTGNNHKVGMDVFRSFMNDRINLNASLDGSFADASSFSESVTDGMCETVSRGTSTSPFRLGGAVNLNGYFGPATIRRKSGKHYWSLGYSYRNGYRSAAEEHTYSSSLPVFQTSDNDEKEHRVQAKLNLREVIKRPFTSSVSLKTGWYGRKYDNSSVINGNAEGMDYRQNVVFLEAVAIGSFMKRLSYLVCLNAEYVDNSGVFANGMELSPLDYTEFNLMPDAGLTWKFRHVDLTASYSRKVRRPRMYQLNPFADIRNPYNISKGNPNLKGEKTDIYSVVCSWTPAVKWMRNLKLTVSYSDAENLISRIVTADAAGVSTSTYCNIGSRSMVNAGLAASFNPARSLSMYLTAFYARSKSILPSGSVRIFDNPSAMLTVSWYPEWFELSGSVAVRPTLSAVQADGLVMEPVAEISMSRYFQKPRIGISLAVTDLFHSGGDRRSRISYDNFVQYNYRERPGRVLGLRIYWRFGRFRQPQTATVEAYDMQ